MAVNITSIATTSNGVFLGDDPLHCAFPLLIIQILLILAVSRTLAFFFRPLRQPRVVAEILGGILLGPSALGRIPQFKQTIFPSWSTPVLGSVANMGLVFFLFLVGIELDMSAIRRSGRGAAAIGATGIACTFGLGAVLAAVLYRTVDSDTKVSYAVYTVFMGVAICITAFPVLARMLAELKLLTTRIGETAMAAAALNDVAAWVFLAIVVSLAGNSQGSKRSPATPAWILLSSIAFVTFLMVVVKPAMRWAARKCSENAAREELFICFTLAGLLASAFMTDLIGIHVIFGGFVFGLTIPKEGDFAGKLTEKIEDFVSCLLLPLYFASSGLRTDITKVSNVRDVELMVLAIAVACAGKIIGTFVVAMLFKFPARESLTLGILMNTKGLVELIVLNIGREDKVLSEESFTILVIMAIFTTFMTTPLVMTIYKPSRVDANGKPVVPATFSDELNVLACVHGPDDASSLIHLIELTRPTFKSPRLKLYIMHLAQLTDRSSSIMKFQRWRRNASPSSSSISCLSGGGGAGEIHGHLSSAFAAYGEVGRAKIMVATAVSPLETMHEEICEVANENNVGMIVVPFHKRWILRPGSAEEVEIVGHGWKRVNEMVLKEAHCTVAVLVDRGRRREPESENVCVIFLGGRDDRKALELGGRMAEKQGVKLVVIRFRNGPANSLTPIEMEQDERSMNEFRMAWEDRVEILENSGADLEKELLGIGRSGAFSLIVVGKGTAVEPSESEFGLAGYLLASSGQGITCSVLVVQSQKTQSELDKEKRGIEYL